jgi:hypothetical protein
LTTGELAVAASPIAAGPAGAAIAPGANAKPMAIAESEASTSFRIRHFLVQFVAHTMVLCFRNRHTVRLGIKVNASDRQGLSNEMAPTRRGVRSGPLYAGQCRQLHLRWSYQCLRCCLVKCWTPGALWARTIGTRVLPFSTGGRSARLSLRDRPCCLSRPRQRRRAFILRVALAARPSFLA